MGNPYLEPAGEPRQGFPRSVKDALPAGGFSGIFKAAELPTELKVSYYIWVIGGLLGLVFGLLGFFGMLFALGLFAAAGAGGLGVLALVLIVVSLGLAAAQVLMAMKLKERELWARTGLTAIAVLSLLLAFWSAGATAAIGNAAGGNWFGVLVAGTATVLMWLPNSSAWLAGRPASGTGRML
ncbi:hypothetical protein ACQ3I4_06275 [Zafaria sp. Z1313]|uniref:hypothetical protein n=1 Tax=unclassified Zafaria TaxID=2828765 RepID=UPI002E790288|nr:hypothetical protein [Zafaria sp. J156]MEE1621561.1 hypothetical protein [Zafaria sp. J156]